MLPVSPPLLRLSESIFHSLRDALPEGYSQLPSVLTISILIFIRSVSATYAKLSTRNGFLQKKYGRTLAFFMKIRDFFLKFRFAENGGVFRK